MAITAAAAAPSLMTPVLEVIARVKRAPPRSARVLRVLRRPPAALAAMLQATVELQATVLQATAELQATVPQARALEAVELPQVVELPAATRAMAALVVSPRAPPEAAVPCRQTCACSVA